MWPLLVAGLGAGLLKSELVDRPREDRQRKLAAETQRYSPWTGLRAGNIQEADPFGESLNMGMTGAAFGQNMDKAAADEALKERQMKWFERNPGMYPDPSSPMPMRPGYNFGTTA